MNQSTIYLAWVTALSGLLLVRPAEPSEEIAAPRQVKAHAAVAFAKNTEAAVAPKFAYDAWLQRAEQYGQDIYVAVVPGDVFEHVAKALEKQTNKWLVQKLPVKFIPFKDFSTAFTGRDPKDFFPFCVSPRRSDESQVDFSERRLEDARTNREIGLGHSAKDAFTRIWLCAPGAL